MAVADDLRVQVMMVGGRRCGKTSVLAAMKRNFEEQFAKTNLTITFGDLETLTVLEAKNDEISDYFSGAGNRTFTPDSNPTDDMMKYTFTIGIADRRGKIRVDFVDYPGEWLTDSSHMEELKTCMEKTQVIIVAIDTPHMLEQDGIYNESRNLCRRVSELLKMALDENSDGKRLILFVPLKCERYLADGRMDEVLEKTKDAYAEIIRYCNRAQSKYEVAVTPIFTLGGAQFSHFETNRLTGKIKINDRFKTPEKPIYYFPETSVKKPSPKYCEQPIVYLLLYLLQLAGDKKASRYECAGTLGKFGIRLQEWLFQTTSAEDYIKERKAIENRLKKQDDGYHIIQNPMKF